MYQNDFHKTITNYDRDRFDLIN